MDDISDLMNMSLSKPQELVVDREACSPRGHKELDMTEWLNRNDSQRDLKKCLHCKL